MLECNLIKKVASHKLHDIFPQPHKQFAFSLITAYQQSTHQLCLKTSLAKRYPRSFMIDGVLTRWLVWWFLLHMMYSAQLYRKSELRYCLRLEISWVRNECMGIWVVYLGGFELWGNLSSCSSLWSKVKPLYIY